MSRYDLAYKAGMSSFLLILLFLIIINSVSADFYSTLEESNIVKTTGFFLALMLSVAGWFLWFTGFRRFKSKIGVFGIAWLMYTSCTIFSGLYMQYRYGRDPDI